jgi:diaminopimelate decarboxylase
MEAFHYQNGTLHCEKVSLKHLAKEAGTPLYVYSRKALEENFKSFKSAFADVPHLICYAIKSNSNLFLLRLFRDLGAAFDIVSGGELFRTRRAGVEPSKIIYSGVGKTISEIDYALTTGILMFNVESKAELETIEARAKFLNQRTRVSLRINPNVDPKTHPSISTGLEEHKFGIGLEEAVPLYQLAARLSHVEVVGISCHIGSQITRLEPLLLAAERIFEILERLTALGIDLQYVDLGGGLGVRYHDESPPTVEEYAQGLKKFFAKRDQTLVLEPGRILTAHAGALLTEVLYLKQNSRCRFVVVDAGMNDLLRPGLYNAYHEIWAVQRNTEETFTAHVVGPICETTDFLAHNRNLPIVDKGDLLAVTGAGAYGFSLSSNYNSRPRPAEVLIESSAYRIIRQRESYEDLVRGEQGY